MTVDIIVVGGPTPGIGKTVLAVSIERWLNQSIGHNIAKRICQDECNGDVNTFNYELNDAINKYRIIIIDKWNGYSSRKFYYNMFPNHSVVFYWLGICDMELGESKCVNTSISRLQSRGSNHTIFRANEMSIGKVYQILSGMYKKWKPPIEEEALKYTLIRNISYQNKPDQIFLEAAESLRNAMSFSIDHVTNDDYKLNAIAVENNNRKVARMPTLNYDLIKRNNSRRHR